MMLVERLMALYDERNYIQKQLSRTCNTDPKQNAIWYERLEIVDEIISSL